MGRMIFIEVLDRRGRVRERVRLERLPASLGRSYTNDVILEDPFVSPLHCTLSENGAGEILLEDQGSLNGVRLVSEESSSGRAPVLRLRSGERFRIGDTVLRLVDAEHPVPPAEPLPADEGGILHSLRSPSLAITAIVASGAAMLLEAYLGAYHERSFAAVAATAVGGLAILGLWAGVWAFVNRLLTHRFDYLRHLACASLALLAFLLVDTLSSYGDFFFSAPRLGTALYVAGILSVLLALLYAHLAIVSLSSRKGRRLRAVFGTALLMGTVALIQHADDEEVVSELPLEIPLKAVGGEHIPAVTTSEFLKDAEWVRESADRMATEEN